MINKTSGVNYSVLVIEFNQSDLTPLGTFELTNSVDNWNGILKMRATSIDSNGILYLI